MNARNPERRRNEPSFVKGVALVATGLVVTLGAGALLVTSQGDRTAEPARTRTNASRPAWASAKEKHTAAPEKSLVTSAAASVERTTAPVEVVAETPAAAADPEPAASVPATWDEAQAAWDAGDWAAAAGRFDGYAAQHPDNPWGHYMKGLSLRQAGEPAQAERALLDCLAIDPDHGKAMVNLVRVRLDLDRPADAVEAAEQAVALDGESVAAHRVLARAYHSQGLRDAAESAYLEALALDPDDAWSLNNLGLLRIEEERFEEAIAPLERACAVDAGQAPFFNNLGVARERTGRYRAAEEAYAQAISLDPSYTKAEVSLARVEPLGGATDEPIGVLATGTDVEAQDALEEELAVAPLEDGREH